MLQIQQRLVDYLEPYAGHQTITDVRIGLGYTAVSIDSGHEDSILRVGSEGGGTQLMKRYLDFETIMVHREI
jgi:hypothetical protein